MSLSKNPEKYPAEFAQLIEKAVGQEVAIRLPSHQEAKRLQGRLYGYIGALKIAIAEPDCPAELREIYQLSHKVQFSLKAHSDTLVARPLDLDPDAQLLRALFASEPQAAPAPKNRQILVPMNPDHLPPGLRELAIKRAESAQK